MKGLGLRVQKLIYGVILINFRIYKEIVGIQRMFENHLSHPLMEDPFILEDAMGRIAPVHLRFITCWEAFEAVLKIRFDDAMGISKVGRGEYVLQESATGRDVDRGTDWNLAFFPGQKIAMSMLFIKVEKDAESGSCPYCFTLSDKSDNSSIQW